MNAERAKGLARLHLALEVIAGLKPLLTQAEADLLDMSMKYDDVDWVGFGPPAPLWDKIKRECVEIVYAFHVEAIRDDDQPDPADVVYGILTEITASKERTFPREKVKLLNPQFVEKMASDGLVTRIGKGLIMGPRGREWVEQYELMHREITVD